MPIASDSELVTGLKNGDDQALESVMRRYNQRLFRIARSIVNDEHEAMDIVQETYVKAFFQIRQFKGPQGFSSWLSQIAMRQALMCIRKRHRSESLTQSGSDMTPPGDWQRDQPEETLAGDQLRKILEEAVEKLPLANRSVFVLRAVQQLNTRDTARSLGLTEEVVRARYSRSKRALRKSFLKKIKRDGLQVYEFAGQRCDLVVKRVLERLRYPVILTGSFKWAITKKWQSIAYTFLLFSL